MKAIVTRNTNSILGAPRDWNLEKHGPCEGLPICATDDPYMYSWWRPTWRERLALLFGHSVRLCVVGTSHPPVALEVERAQLPTNQGKERP